MDVLGLRLVGYSVGSVELIMILGGDTVGSVVGEIVGSFVGDIVGSVVGEIAGSGVGDSVSSTVGLPKGSSSPVYMHCNSKIVTKSTE